MKPRYRLYWEGTCWSSWKFDLTGERITFKGEFAF